MEQEPLVSLNFYPLELSFAHPWTIARGSSREKKNGLVVLTAEGMTGYGEAAPNERYGQSFDSASLAFARAREAVVGLSPWEHLEWLSRIESVVGNDSAVLAAFDVALWDWKGKKCSQPVWKLIGTSPRSMPVTSFSIGLDSLDTMKAKVREAADYPILKVKMGAGNDKEILQAVRSVTNRPLRVDINEGWSTVSECIEKITYFSEHNVEFVEQPLPVSKLKETAEARKHVSLKIIADEAVLALGDLLPLNEAFDGVNIKLAKCGGITKALSMIAAARALGLLVMLGCMVESALGIAAAVQIAPLSDYVDLDGNLLLASDPFEGLSMQDARWLCSESPGLGVSPSSLLKTRIAVGNPILT